MKLLRSIASLLVLLVIANSVYGLSGTRPMGMGGAYTGVCNDANAAFWNPAGLALNPGIDVTGSVLLTNRNVAIGDNVAAFKACFETELNPFIWIIGIGAATLAAYEGAKYLSDQGVVKKNWGRNDGIPTVSKDQAMSEQVLQGGTEKTVAVGQKIKEEAKELAAKVLNKSKEVAKTTGVAVAQGIGQGIGAEMARPVYWGPVRYPYYHADYTRPTYWDQREAKKEYSPEGKAQFAGGVAIMTDKNPILNQNTNYYTLSVATGYQENVAFGANLNFYDITLPIPNNIKGYGAGLDLGALINFADKFTWGVTAKEILTTDIHFENGQDRRFPMSVNTGISVSPIDKLTLAADMHNIFQQNATPQTYHYGAEFRPFPGLALRGGLHDNSKTAGIGIMIGQFILDYAYLGGAFNRTQMAGVTWKI